MYNAWSLNFLYYAIICIVISFGLLATVWKMAQQAATPPVVVVVNRLADLLPDSYSGDDTSVDIDEFFAR